MTSLKDLVGEFVDAVIAPLFVVVVYEEHSPSHIVGPFHSFNEATEWEENYPWREDAYGEVFALFPPDEIAP